jgi:hypothetical protein
MFRFSYSDGITGITGLIDWRLVFDVNAAKIAPKTMFGSNVDVL